MVVFAAGFLGRRPSGQRHADGTFSGRNVNEENRMRPDHSRAGGPAD
jgi:hypothetical protein